MRYNPHIKRLLDFSLALTAFLCLSPLFFFISFFICIESKGSPFFVQKRIGRGAIPFRLVKFRSMTILEGTDSGSFEPGNDSRVTKIGGLIRKLKIDELPQLLNVLNGEMSIVGPRPEVAEYVSAYPSEFKRVLTVRPGLSDFASLKYIDEESILAEQEDPELYYRNVILPDKLLLSTCYAQNVSLKIDLSIIFYTIGRYRKFHLNTKDRSLKKHLRKLNS